MSDGPIPSGLIDAKDNDAERWGKSAPSDPAESEFVPKDPSADDGQAPEDLSVLDKELSQKSALHKDPGPDEVPEEPEPASDPAAQDWVDATTADAEVGAHDVVDAVEEPHEERGDELIGGEGNDALAVDDEAAGEGQMTTGEVMAEAEYDPEVEREIGEDVEAREKL